MITHFQLISPHPRIAGYVERIFIMKSSGKLPSADLKLIVPNACPKLVIPFKNGVIGGSSQWQHISKENKITFIGMSDIPASVDFLHDDEAGNITIEFNALGAYRFLNFNWSDITNRIYNYSDVIPLLTDRWEERLANTPAIADKVALIQQFLVSRFAHGTDDPLFDHCVNQITRSNGKVSIKQLERYTGYSARWLNMKFKERLGISPKNLASIVRFQQCYHSFITGKEDLFTQKKFYDHYYDRSHFIKDFKRFTGHAPTMFSENENDYDRYFFQ